MKYVALILYIISGTFVWFFMGDLALRVNPFDALMIFSLLFINKVTQMILKPGEKK